MRAPNLKLLVVILPGKTPFYGKYFWTFPSTFPSLTLRIDGYMWFLILWTLQENKKWTEGTHIFLLLKLWIQANILKIETKYLSSTHDLVLCKRFYVVFKQQILSSFLLIEVLLKLDNTLLLYMPRNQVYSIVSDRLNNI